MKITAVKNTPENFLAIVNSILPDINGCKIWPMGINSVGYGIYHMHGKSLGVHRLLYFILNPDQCRSLIVRHKCDNRSCCNINHLEIGTQKENIQDASNRKRLRVGIENNKAQLTEKQVIYCRNSYPNKSTYQLAQEMNVEANTIAKAICGKTWKHLPHTKNIIQNRGAKGEKSGRCKLKEKDVLEIRKQYPHKTKAELARKYNMTHAAICAIINKKSWRHI